MDYYSPILNKNFLIDEIEKNSSNVLKFVNMYNSCVYEHISPKGKRYYGITRQNPFYIRWRKGEGYKNNKSFFKDICKFGWDNFQHNKITDYINIFEAFYLEYALIITNKTFDDAFGYNHESVCINDFLKQYTIGNFDIIILDEILRKYANTCIKDLRKCG